MMLSMPRYNLQTIDKVTTTASNLHYSFWFNRFRILESKEIMHPNTLYIHPAGNAGLTTYFNEVKKHYLHSAFRSVVENVSIFGSVNTPIHLFAPRNFDASWCGFVQQCSDYFKNSRFHCLHNNNSITTKLVHYCSSVFIKTRIVPNITGFTSETFFKKLNGNTSYSFNLIFLKNEKNHSNSSWLGHNEAYCVCNSKLSKNDPYRISSIAYRDLLIY